MQSKKTLSKQAVKLLDNYRVGLHHNKNFIDDDKITDALKEIITALNK